MKLKAIRFFGVFVAFLLLATSPSYADDEDEDVVGMFHV